MKKYAYASYEAEMIKNTNKRVKNLTYFKSEQNTNHKNRTQYKDKILMVDDDYATE